MSVPRFWRELDTRYNLIGSYCKITKTYHYPRRSFNPEAGRESIGSMEDYQFKGTGEIVSSTVVHQAQTGYEMFGPYCIAIIKLDEGPQITTQIGILHYGTKFILNEVSNLEEPEENMPDIEV